jgi:hypothetical protein
MLRVAGTLRCSARSTFRFADTKSNARPGIFRFGFKLF